MAGIDVGGRKRIRRPHPESPLMIWSLILRRRRNPGLSTAIMYGLKLQYNHPLALGFE